LTIKKKATKKATKKKVSKRRSNPSLKSNSSKEIHGAILSTTTLSEIEAKIFVLTDFLEQEKREIEESNTNDIRAARFNKLISILEILNHNVEEMDAQLSQVLDYYQID
jgi:hypothetical protein